MMLNPRWLEACFPWIESCASDVVRNTLGNAVYGCLASFSNESGQATVSEEKKESVQKLYALLNEYCEKSGHEKPSLGYFLVVSGDYEMEHEEYIPLLDEEDD